MAKYKLKALNVMIRGVAYYKENKDIFDTDGKHKPAKAEVEAAYKAGYLELIEEPETPKKVKKNVNN